MKIMSRTLIFLFLISGLTSGQSRIEFHLLPAVSTGPLSPSWSPDGKSLVFSMRGDIWILPAQGGAAKALTQGPAYHFEPTISPDGSKVALSLAIDGHLESGIIDISGAMIIGFNLDGIPISPGERALLTMSFTGYADDAICFYDSDCEGSDCANIISLLELTAFAYFASTPRV